MNLHLALSLVLLVLILEYIHSRLQFLIIIIKLSERLGQLFFLLIDLLEYLL